jgi:hypothetical protein
MSEREKLIEAMARAMCREDEIEIPSIAHDGSISADWLAMTLAEDARIENGRLANAEYLAVKIASASDFILARAVKAEAEVERLRAVPGLSDVIAGKAVIVPVEPTAEMVSAGTYHLADHLCASEYVNGPDASVVLALAHTAFVGAFSVAVAANPYRKAE